MAHVFVCVRRTRDEVEALLVFHTGFNLAGEQVQSGWRFVRLHERRGTTKEKKKSRYGVSAVPPSGSCSEMTLQRWREMMSY